MPAYCARTASSGQTKPANRNGKRALRAIGGGTRVACAGANLINCLEQRCLGARPDTEHSRNWGKYGRRRWKRCGPTRVRAVRASRPIQTKSLCRRSLRALNWLHRRSCSRTLTLALSGRPQAPQARGRRKMTDASNARRSEACHGPLERVVRCHGSTVPREAGCLEVPSETPMRRSHSDCRIPPTWQLPTGS